MYSNIELTVYFNGQGYENYQYDIEYYNWYELESAMKTIIYY